MTIIRLVADARGLRGSGVGSPGSRQSGSAGRILAVRRHHSAGRRTSFMSFWLPLTLLFGSGSGSAFESNEHREIGNCALGIAHRWVSAAASSKGPDSPLTKMARQMELMLPNRSISPLCKLPENTNGISDWIARLKNNSLQIDADPKTGRRIWDPKADDQIDADSVVTYGHISSLVDSYLYPERLFALGANFGERPSEPKHLLSNDGKLPWPEDVRAIDSNDAHFRGLAVLSYWVHHKSAVDAARTNTYGALVANAVADHYLLDLFAPGHVMAARQTIPAEIALAMHDHANAVGAHFVLEAGANIENLRKVLGQMSADFEPLFCEVLGAPESARACTDVDRDRSAHRAVRRELELRDVWLPKPDGDSSRVMLRGDNFLTAKKMADPKIGSEQSRQYLLTVAVQVMSILDALQEVPGANLCKHADLDCEALRKGFRTIGENSGLGWQEPEVDRRDGSKWRIWTPRVHICCGHYAFTDATEDILRLSSLRSQSVQKYFPQNEPLRLAEDPKDGGGYRYPEADNIWGVTYAREYSSRPGQVAPYSVALSVTRLASSASGEVLSFKKVGLAAEDKAYFDSSWLTATVSLRFDARSPRQRYGLELRGVTNLGKSPWLFGMFGRYGQYHDETGQRHNDNGLGMVLEMHSTLFRFAIVGGTRGLPVFDRVNRYYGFEVGLFLPTSRLPVVGAK